MILYSCLGEGVYKDCASFVVNRRDAFHTGGDLSEGDGILAVLTRIKALVTISDG